MSKFLQCKNLLIIRLWTSYQEEKKTEKPHRRKDGRDDNNDKTNKPTTIAVQNGMKHIELSISIGHSYRIVHRCGKLCQNGLRDTEPYIFIDDGCKQMVFTSVINESHIENQMMEGKGNSLYSRFCINNSNVDGSARAFEIHEVVAEVIVLELFP